jgi:hypothetical protein
VLWRNFPLLTTALLTPMATSSQAKGDVPGSLLVSVNRADVRSPNTQLDSCKAGSFAVVSVRVCADPPDATPAESCCNLAAFKIILFTGHAAALVIPYG